jgi:hypothetical protein
MQQRTGRAASPDQGLIFASFILRMHLKLGMHDFGPLARLRCERRHALRVEHRRDIGGSYRFGNHVTQTLCHFRRCAFRRKHSEPGIDLIVAYAGVRFRSGELTQGRD